MPMRMPAAFVGHGSPMNALEHNRYTEAWRQLGASIPRPTAVLAISAHWYVNAIAVTAMPNPRTIYDFSGFPPELSRFSYPVPGSPDLARRVTELLAGHEVIADDGQWGIDHGTWSVLCHIFPNADIPVVQLSIDARLSPAEHVALGKLLAPLREEGVFIVGSGNVVHHLGRISWGREGFGEPWAIEFDEAVKSLAEGNSPARVIETLDRSDAHLSVPTPEHFLPVAYIAGLAEVAGVPLRTFVAGCEMGSLSMRSFVLAD
jgi:4,5-DOPA dioxygenase extradiol